MKITKIIFLSIFFLSACSLNSRINSSEDLESIFLGHRIFTGNSNDFNQDPDIQFDLRHNPRYIAFQHLQFPSHKVTDEDIMNWAAAYLYTEVFLPWRESLLSGETFDPAGDQSWAIINLDNEHQIAIVLKGATYAPGDTFVVAYRQQNSDALHQRNLDWFDLAYGTFVLGDNTIEWQGFVEDKEGNYSLITLSQSPFE